MELTLHNLPAWQRQFLDARRSVTPRPMLDVAAHLLFYLSEPATLHVLALEHLLVRLHADRADLGFSSSQAETYTPQAEFRVSRDIPSVQQVSFPNRDPGVQIVWNSPQGVSLNVRCDPVVRNLRPFMQGVLGTQSKLAHRLEHHSEVFGMLCLDQIVSPRQWHNAESQYVDQFLGEVLSPLLFASHRLQVQQAVDIPSLTPAEKQILSLFELGLTSKEIAQRLHKSPNTVDNQLSGLRHKLGLRNRVELLRVWEALKERSETNMDSQR
ncbi:helix-turn-helix transcriptional regulator [Deinococcus sp.]|uniref:helix-turn-helix domain-containing protein n=1 Tax=Deinococcus sp. TaxID=47478 RepID=UPI0025C3F447|nr:helix-turn-helix transcriptional regulator [Deinococcus sp.]